MRNVLIGKRILVVEDELLISMLLIDILTECGCHVVGPASTLDEARQAIATEEIDVALLDVNLRGENGFALADDLHKKGIPFAFCTGYGADTEVHRHAGARVVRKPYTDDEVRDVLEELCANSGSS